MRDGRVLEGVVAAMTEADEIQLHRAGGIATLTINRPQALNALTLENYRRFAPALAGWAEDPAVRAVVLRGAASLDAGDPEATLHCAMAKRFATDAGFHVCNEALQLHGGYGYLKDFPIERYLRDLRVHQILEGTNEIMRVIIARRLLGPSNA